MEKNLSKINSEISYVALYDMHTTYLVHSLIVPFV
jgi:hypothetical protein